DQSILQRNNMLWHTARDDTMFTSMRCISRHEKTQVYGAILLKGLTNQAMLESKSYKTYYAFASEEKTPKPNSYVSGLGDGVDTQSKVPNEQHLKTTGADEGTGTILRVLDVPMCESKNEKESWGDSEDEDEDDVIDSDDISDEGDDDNDGNNGNDGDDDDDANDDDKQESDDKNDNDEETDSDRTESDKIKILVLDQSTTKFYEEEEEKIDDEEQWMKKIMMRLLRSCALEQQNASQKSGFEQEVKDAHVTLTLVLDTQNTGEKELSEKKQVDQYAQALSSIPTIVDRYMDNKLGEAINKEVNAQLPQILPHAISDVATPVIVKNVTESLEAADLTRMEKNISFDIADYKIELYDAMGKYYNTDNVIFESYGTKRRKSSKDAESSRDLRSKEKKFLSTSKDASQSQHKSSGKSAHAEEAIHTVEDSSMQQDQESITGDNDEQPANKEVTKADCIQPAKRHLHEYYRVRVSFEECSKATTERRRYSTSVTKTKAATYDLKWIEDLSPVQVKYDQHAYLGTSHWGPKRQSFYGYASNMTSSKDVYSRRRIITVTRLKIIKKYDYGHVEEIEVRRDDQKLYTFREGDFKRLRL
nr:hypothetical protein [Tanacetum cinerariifolium]